MQIFSIKGRYCFGLWVSSSLVSVAAVKAACGEIVKDWVWLCANKTIYKDRWWPPGCLTTLVLGNTIFSSPLLSVSPLKVLLFWFLAFTVANGVSAVTLIFTQMKVIKSFLCGCFQDLSLVVLSFTLPY